MATPKKTPINPGFISRLTAGLKYALSGKGPEWFGPLEPLEPMAPPGTGARAYDYPTGANLQYIPRGAELVSFDAMRALADNYDLLRLVIETRKDQVVKIEWNITGKDGKDIPESDPRPGAIKDFFAKPDREHTWQQWLRTILEDMLVIDAASIYPRPTVGGNLYSLEIIDGATIKKLIDLSGRTPNPPEPAYQQIIKGSVATEYTVDELIYLPRNLRSNKSYGYSPVEQIIITVNLALRRQLHQLEFYTEGSVPDAITALPAEWTIDQVKEMQAWWDSLLRGNTAERRNMRFIPGGKDTQITFTKKDSLKDEMDEWLARVICYCFSVSPTPFIKQMNRATAQTVQEAALNEGLIPLLAWIKDLMNIIIWQYLGCLDLEFSWKIQQDVDAKTQADIDASDVEHGIKSIDEVREARGLKPIGMGPAYFTASGPILLEQFIEEAAAKHEAALEAIRNPPPPMLPQPPGTPPAPAAEPDAEGGTGKKTPPNAPGKGGPPVAASKLHKGGKKKQANPIDRERPLIKAQTKEIKSVLQDGFSEVSKDVAGQVIEEKDRLGEDTPLDAQAEAQRIVAALDVSAIDKIVADNIQENLETVASDGARMALIQIDYNGQDLTELLNQKALDYAQERGAELVGKRVVDGEVIDNPNPEWAISENTRDMLRADISQAIEEGWSNDKLASAIEDNYGFSPERAETIARTETAFADSAGNMAAYRESGMVEGKEWILGSEHEVEDECDENAAAGVIPLEEDFPSGDPYPPCHPKDVCDWLPVLAEEEGAHGEEVTTVAPEDVEKILDIKKNDFYTPHYVKLRRRAEDRLRKDPQALVATLALLKIK